jgi:hypothetical protein
MTRIMNIRCVSSSCTSYHGRGVQKRGQQSVFSFSNPLVSGEQCELPLEVNGGAVTIQYKISWFDNISLPKVLRSVWR